MVKRTKRLLEAASNRLDLPGEIVAGLPKIELTGFSRLSIEQHSGVLTYSTETVIVDVGIGRVKITGRELAISLMNHTYVIVTGKLQGIELVPGGVNG